MNTIDVKEICIYNIIAINIKKYMKDITISKLAYLTNINEDKLCKFINNKHGEISIDDLYKISVVLNVSINKFFEN